MAMAMGFGEILALSPFALWLGAVLRPPCEHLWRWLIS